MTVINDNEVGRGVYYKEISALSTETKPTKANNPTFNLADQSIIIESDTGNVYYYKSSTDSWEVFGGE